MHPRTPTAQDSVDGTCTGPRMATTHDDGTPHPHSIDNLPDCRPTTACCATPSSASGPRDQR